MKYFGSESFQLEILINLNFFASKKDWLQSIKDLHVFGGESRKGPGFYIEGTLPRKRKALGLEQ